ncbi:MAG: glycosyltransferase [Balneolales bacterium]
MTPFISVIIPTFRDWSRLQLCVQALKQQTLSKDTYEVIIVNNDPENPIPSALELPENCTLTEESKVGSYAARNKGIQIARGNIYAFTDSDCIPNRDWLEQTMLKLKMLNVDGVAGKVEFVYVNEFNLSSAELYEKLFGFPFQRKKRNGEETKNLVTANFVCKRHLFQGCGLFNGDLKSGGDSLFAKKVISKGYRIIYCEEAIVKHPSRYRIVELARKRQRVLGGKIDAQQNHGNKEIYPFLYKVLEEQARRMRFVVMKNQDDWPTKLKLLYAMSLISVYYVGEAVRIKVGGRTRRY